jgi:hypoxanthine-DNA glycosylase
MHKQNRFWPVLAAVFGEDTPQGLEQRKQFALRHGIALWDVLESCDINGASDGSIRNAKANDIKALINKTKITRIFCTGQKAYTLYQKLCAPLTGIDAERLPSTSPANAARSFAELTAAYRIIAGQGTKVRNTTLSDLPAVLRIYEEARQFMAASGNPNQWGASHPPQEIIEDDIRRGISYVYTNKHDEPIAVFAFIKGDDPTYAVIEGAWLNDAPYAVIHRIARSQDAQGAGAACLDWCMQQAAKEHRANIRIDTHQDNKPMQKLLAKKGFSYCGVIHLANGQPRLAFQVEV